MYTLILNIWKRDYLKEQIRYIINQTVLPSEIWVIQYEYHVSVDEILHEYRNRFKIVHIHSSENLKYFGRFSLANLVTTEYVWLLDDDILPGKHWAEMCIEKVKLTNCLITGAGRTIPNGSYRPETPYFYYKNFFGDASKKNYNYTSKDTLVDFGIQSYFLKSKWIASFWKIYPSTFESGEDIHLAASLKIDLGIKTMVPVQKTLDTSGNLNKALGSDQHASWRQNNFFSIREQIIRDLIDNKGWQPMDWENKLTRQFKSFFHNLTFFTMHLHRYTGCFINKERNKKITISEGVGFLFFKESDKPTDRLYLIEPDKFNFEFSPRKTVSFNQSKQQFELCRKETSLIFTRQS
jgi:hypothetical protein